MSQKKKVLEFMQTHGSITPQDAVNMGIFRLAARVWELNREGVPISSTIEKSVNRDGEDVRYARYAIAP